MENIKINVMALSIHLSVTLSMCSGFIVYQCHDPVNFGNKLSKVN